MGVVEAKRFAPAWWWCVKVVGLIELDGFAIC